MEQIVKKLLAFFARRIIAKYHPIVIGITGSVGKTSAREAVFAVVNQHYRAARSQKNFNNEIGLPLAIIGAEELPEKNIFSWIGIVLKAIGWIILPRTYPELLVLEMGIDHPGDMDFLLTIVKPHIAIITNIGISHYEYFNNAEEIEKEKGKIGRGLSERDFLIVNSDNEPASRQAGQSKARIIGFGIDSDGALVRATDIIEHLRKPYSTTISFVYRGANSEATIQAVGKAHVYAALAAVSVASALGLDFSSVYKGLGIYRASAGRLNIIDGINGSTIIDDSYNASPDSTRTALALLDRYSAPHKIAVLGDMRELGTATEMAHRDIGRAAALIKIDELVTVGPNARMIAEEAVSGGMNQGAVHSFDTADEAKFFVKKLIRPQTVVLLKGSQNTIRLEKIAFEIMAEPERAKELLVRQYGSWLKT